jgi:hypothetical protein
MRAVLRAQACRNYLYSLERATLLGGNTRVNSFQETPDSRTLCSGNFAGVCALVAVIGACELFDV